MQALITAAVHAAQAHAAHAHARYAAAGSCTQVPLMHDSHQNVCHQPALH